MEIQSTSEMSPYFTMTKCNKLFIGRAKRAPHWGVQSRFRVIYILNIQPFRVEYRYILYPKVGIFPEAGGRGKYSLQRVQYMPIFHKEGF